MLNLLPETDPLGVSTSDLAALLVGTPRKCMASLPRNSLTDERITARPSPDLHSRWRKMKSEKEKDETHKHTHTRVKPGIRSFPRSFQLQFPNFSVPVVDSELQLTTGVSKHRQVFSPAGVLAQSVCSPITQLTCPVAKLAQEDRTFIYCSEP